MASRKDHPSTNMRPATPKVMIEIRSRTIFIICFSQSICLQNLLKLNLYQVAFEYLLLFRRMKAYLVLYLSIQKSLFECELVLDRYKITYGRGDVKAGRSFSEIHLDSEQSFTYNHLHERWDTKREVKVQKRCNIRLLPANRQDAELLGDRGDSGTQVQECRIKACFKA